MAAVNWKIVLSKKKPPLKKKDSMHWLMKIWICQLNPVNRKDNTSFLKKYDIATKKKLFVKAQSPNLKWTPENLNQRLLMLVRHLVIPMKTII